MTKYISDMRNVIFKIGGGKLVCEKCINDMRNVICTFWVRAQSCDNRYYQKYEKCDIYMCVEANVINGIHDMRKWTGIC